MTTKTTAVKKAPPTRKPQLVAKVNESDKTVVNEIDAQFLRKITIDNLLKDKLVKGAFDYAYDIMLDRATKGVQSVDITLPDNYFKDNKRAYLSFITLLTLLGYHLGEIPKKAKKKIKLDIWW